MPAIADITDSYNKTTSAKKIAWMDKGKNAVKQRLKDPNSAEFRNVYFHRGSDNIPVTCGEVNSKNSFGGYGGFQKFVSGGTLELSILQNEVSDFSVTWKQLCQ
ncbi:hypothetical protein FS418_11180 [Shewanella sp. YLB-09]|nr:hypothetical protein FS418_11180 [Shewanella sp. YLB-09]